MLQAHILISEGEKQNQCLASFVSHLLSTREQSCSWILALKKSVCKSCMTSNMLRLRSSICQDTTWNTISISTIEMSYERACPPLEWWFLESFTTVIWKLYELGVDFSIRSDKPQLHPNMYPCLPSAISVHWNNFVHWKLIIALKTCELQRQPLE